MTTPMGSTYFETDKGALGYVSVYQALAGMLGSGARICEVGVQHGGGLRFLRYLFPQGPIVGVDINDSPHWPHWARKIIMRQDDPELPTALGGTFDLIVDDASHLGAETAATFKNLWPLVAPDGWYVIEDWFVGLPRGGRFTRYNFAENTAMLDTVRDLILLLDDEESDVESVTYRFGLAIVHKRGSK